MRLSSGKKTPPPPCEAPSAPEEASAAEVEAQPQEAVETSTEGGVTAV